MFTYEKRSDIFGGDACFGLCRNTSRRVVCIAAGASVVPAEIATARNSNSVQTACIRVGDVAYLARCEMELNVTTWRKLRDGCPEARLSVGTNLTQ